MRGRGGGDHTFAVGALAAVASTTMNVGKHAMKLYSLAA